MEVVIAIVMGMVNVMVGIMVRLIELILEIIEGILEMIVEARIEKDRHFLIHLVEIQMEVKIGPTSRLMQMSVVECEEGRVNIVKQSGMNSGQLKW